MFDLDSLLRDNIKRLKPYASARDEFDGPASVYLDANENPFGSVTGAYYNRYPDPLQRKLKARIGQIKGIDPSSIFVGNGSDEGIDLLIRAFCRPGVDKIMQLTPTYGLYEVAADINGVEVISVPLTSEYEPIPQTVFDQLTPLTKIVFLCSPNNPTGNLLPQEFVLALLDRFDGIVVVDEAYIDFAPEGSVLQLLADRPNLVVLQTLSKAWGMAGIRLGMAFAHPDIVRVLSKIKYPYNINAVTQNLALQALQHESEMKASVQKLVGLREKLAKELIATKGVLKVYPSDANFLLVKMERARETYEALLKKGIVVRDRSHVPGSIGCIRITVGTETENRELITALETLKV